MPRAMPLYVLRVMSQGLVTEISSDLYAFYN